MREKAKENAGVAALGVAVAAAAGGPLIGAGYPAWGLAFIIIGCLIVAFSVIDTMVTGLRPPISWTWSYLRRVRIDMIPADGIRGAVPPTAHTESPTPVPTDLVHKVQAKRRVKSDGVIWTLDAWRIDRVTNERTMVLRADCADHLVPLLYWDPIERGAVSIGLAWRLGSSDHHGDGLYCAGPNEGEDHIIQLTESKTWDEAYARGRVRMQAVLDAG